MKSDHLVLGILAHVDAGKTTLSESILYLQGALRKMGRVDHKDAFLDTHELEKLRGITIFAKQAEFVLNDRKVTLLDTPGHVDFSPEMERSLQVLDAAVLVISASDGVTGQVRILWKLLKHYELPVFIFVNKMDQPGADRDALLAQLKKELDDRCLLFPADLADEDTAENLAVLDDDLMERYLQEGMITEADVTCLFGEQKVIPCYFGSALKVEGVEDLLDGLSKYLPYKEYAEEFGARVYKISRDPQGTRLSWMKITGGSLKVKTLLSGSGKSGDWQEKADQLRIYSGNGFNQVQLAEAGQIVAVSGLRKTHCGDGLGIEPSLHGNVLESVLTYELLLPAEVDVTVALSKLRTYEEEEPMLHVKHDIDNNTIYVQVMGQVQMEILKQIMLDRFDLKIGFGPGKIVYKETILYPVEGVGHYEPLRHYAEVHLLLEPSDPGSGLTFASICSEDVLDKNWQRLIMTHLEEKPIKGVLTGSEVTDLKVTILTGRAHEKHTEGGDFRQATYRALRQGLMMAESILLEPVYQFRLELPSENLGRALSDLQRMGGKLSLPDTDGVTAILTGSIPAAALGNYQEELTAYSKGQGKIFCSLKGYEPCHNTEEVLLDVKYDPDQDLDNPSGSIFCSHGAGYFVPWNEVASHMHLDSGWNNEESLANLEYDAYEDVETGFRGGAPKGAKEETLSFKERESRYSAGQDELREIFERTYGPIAKKGEEIQDIRAKRGWKKKTFDSGSCQYGSGSKGHSQKKKNPDKKYMLVDGYNIIFAWDELKKLAENNIDAARDKLMDILSDYQGYTNSILILVFDAYKVKGGAEKILKYHNILVVYTKEAETADQYIEKTVHEIGHDYQVTVATSDALEQIIIMGGGAARMSAAGLFEEIKRVKEESREGYISRQGSDKNYLMDHASKEVKELLHFSEN